MSKTLLIAAAFLALAACDNQPTTITANGSVDPMADELANATPVELPPSVKDSKSYRCADSSIVFVDFLADDTTANFRTERTGTPTQLKAAAAGQAFTAEGYSLSGSGDSVSLTTPAKGSQTCKA